MSQIESASANPAPSEAGSLTSDEAAAMLSATEVQRPSRMTWELVDQIIDITEQYPSDKARNILYDVLADRVSITIDKDWTNDDVAAIA